MAMTMGKRRHKQFIVDAGSWYLDTRSRANAQHVYTTEDSGQKTRQRHPANHKASGYPVFLLVGMFFIVDLDLRIINR